MFGSNFVNRRVSTFFVIGRKLYIESANANSFTFRLNNKTHERFIKFPTLYVGDFVIVIFLNGSEVLIIERSSLSLKIKCFERIQLLRFIE